MMWKSKKARRKIKRRPMRRKVYLIIKNKINGNIQRCKTWSDVTNAQA